MICPEDIEIGTLIEFVHYDADLNERGIDTGHCNELPQIYKYKNGDVLLYMEIKVTNGLRLVAWKNSAWHMV